MSNRFKSYGDTRIGRELAAIIDAPELIPEFRALSAIGKPAVQAIAADVTDIINALPTKAEKDAASQFCGWYVGQIMQQLGYRLVQERGRVTGAPFKTGAVWEHQPAEVQVGLSLPHGVTRRVELVVKRSTNGEIVGDWCTVQTANNPGRRVHTIVESPRAFESALQNALAYARRWQFSYLLIRDPERVLPVDRWKYPQ